MKASNSPVPTALPRGLARAPPRARPTTGKARQCPRGYGHGSRGGRYRAPVPRERDRQAPVPAGGSRRPSDRHVVDVVIRSVDDLQPESRHQRVVERNTLLEPPNPQDDVGNAVDLHRSLPVCGAATSVRRVVQSPQLGASMRGPARPSGPLRRSDEPFRRLRVGPASRGQWGRIGQHLQPGRSRSAQRP